MIKIKFRAWAIASRVMFYPDADDGWEITNGKIIPLPNTVLMQYTGLEDKNGKEIYEGDIVKIINGIVEIKSISEIWSAIGWRDKKWHKNLGNEGNTIERLNFEVIGNICENPELLK